MNPWERLLLLARDDRPPPDLEALYEKPPQSPTDEVARTIARSPASHSKILLVGARGGGKSTELRRVSQLLRGKSFFLAEVDLDGSEIGAASVSAFDLAYLACVAMLRGCRDTKIAESLFEKLKTVYARHDEVDKKSLGLFQEALSGIANFAEKGGLAASAAGADLALGLPPASSIAAGYTVATWIRLLSKNQDIVAESSPSGRAMAEVAVQIGRQVSQDQGKPLAVLIDGLEKMNGQSGERFRQIFEQTRLLVELPWSMVIAAPPCTLSETNSADITGYQTHVVWGFPPGDTGIENLLRRRLSAAGLASEAVEASLLPLIASQSGGLPRYAVWLLHAAVNELEEFQPAAVLGMKQAEGALRKVRASLWRGITEDDYPVLAKVRETKKIGSSRRSATLFADGRILAHAPGDDGILLFDVHPLMILGLDKHQKSS